jgi:hypothetical protein
MKKRHEQKLVILSVVLFVLFNAPILLLFNKIENYFRASIIYVYIFGIWLLSVIISFVIFKNLMNSIELFAIIMLYLALLFFIAFWAEKRKSNFWANNPYVYSLSLAVYCTAWTYYGSIGVAANQGLEYLAIYIGPIIIIPVGLSLILRLLEYQE